MEIRFAKENELSRINELRKQLERIDCLKIDSTSLLVEDVLNKALSYINSK